MSAPRFDTPSEKDIDLEASVQPVEPKSDAEVLASASVDDETSDEPSRSWKEAVQSLKTKDAWIGDYVGQ